MRKLAVFFSSIIFFFVLFGCQDKLFPEQDRSSKQVRIRMPAVAGSFYPSQPGLLKEEVSKFMSGAVYMDKEDDLVACMAPHAGYVYSAGIAAYSYRAMQTADFDTVVIIGHDTPVGGYAAFLSDYDFFRTPFGDVPVDTDMVKDIVSFDRKLVIDNGMHEKDHTIEVHLPFLQSFGKRFKIVPVLFGNPNEYNCRILADAVLKASGSKRVIILASTDMSHYPSYELAASIDRSTLNSIRNLDIKEFFSGLDSQEKKSLPGVVTALCSRGGVGTAILFSRMHNATGVKILKYANSGDVPFGNKKKVVGYGSAVIYGKFAPVPVNKEESMLNDIERKKLLKIARDTIKMYLQTGKMMEIPVPTGVLKEVRGAFVTLHRGGNLRGCIGNIVGKSPLYITIRDMAIAASTEDPRFPGVTLQELEDIDIEISVLSPLKKVSSADDIEIGRHGVIVRKGFRQGVFLPQVALETGWSKEEFLSNLCSGKAGLPSDAWKDGSAELYVFTAEVFGEKE